MKTTHEYRGYIFTIAYQPRDPAYTVDFPDLPDIITSGDTLADQAPSSETWPVS
jgi:predicted RNase H-like HicB family nuclease